MRLKHSIILLIGIASLLYNCSSKNEAAIISCNIKNIGFDTVSVAMAPFDEKLSNQFITVITKDGKFEIDTLIDKLYYGKIIYGKMFEKLSNGEKYLIRSKPIDFFIYPNEKIEIQGKNEKTKTDYQINGNYLNAEFYQYREKVINDFEESSKLMFQIENHYISNSPDSIINILSLQERKAYTEYLEKTLQFIKENSDSEISAFLLLKEEQGEIISLFPNLDEKVRESDYGKLIQEKIKIWNQLKIGTSAPDFKYLTYNSKSIQLSEYKGKFVVLDFWGSWCAPCKMEIPKLKEFYNENRKKVEIIGIACRDTKEQWEKVIKEDNLNWTQILNNKENLDLNKTYGISGFPTKIIINPNGIIEGYFIGVSNEFYIKMTELLKE